MHTLTRSTFTAVHSEGGILPADLLQRIGGGRGLDGLTPDAYHLLPSERLNEAISRAWTRCLTAWRGFDAAREELPPADRGTSLTRERWLLVLFQELGYGRLPFAGSLPADPADPNSATYPISHRWEQTPLHLVSFRDDLDRRAAERSEAGRRSPHSLVQEYLNRSEGALWGFVSNGLRLRVLRDNASLTRAAFVEFDLEVIMAGELYADFALLWLVCHQSRVEGPDRECWLERWSRAAAEQGVRALNALRDGVQETITALGRGFLAHPANAALRKALQTGALRDTDYYRQLLRLVYRLIILFVAEDRDLLFPPEAMADARRRYMAYYSLGRLREIAALLRGSPHPDLYRGLRLTFEHLRSGYPALGMPALGGFLFSARSTPDLDAADIANQAWLDAVRALAFTVEGRVRRAVDYRNLDSEELGSVYESLLELHPHVNVAAAAFELVVVAGSERKTTGSHYTATPLVSQLLDSALEPVIAARLKAARTVDEKEKALLRIRVLDYACGSGHILIGASRRLARHLARIRTGEEEPSPADLRAALRDVVRHCIYGVDINPMAVELCKLALWMETLEPGKPLSFLDHHIQCGNSLVGTSPRPQTGEQDEPKGQKTDALLEDEAEGLVVPDEAFAPVAGDDKAAASFLRKLNRTERSRNAPLIFLQTQEDLARWQQTQAASLEAMPEDSVEQVAGKASAYEQYLASTAYRREKLAHDLWTAAFFWPIRPGAGAAASPAPTHGQLALALAGKALDDALARQIGALAEQLRFFHWELAFPEVAEAGGFDCVLSNPPWERIKLQEQEFFAVRDPEIAAAPNKAARQELIDALPRTNPALASEFVRAKHAHEAQSKFVRQSGRFPLAAVGDVNTYALFAELARVLLAGAGRAGIIVPTGIATDDTTKDFFGDLVEKRTLASLYDFENREAIFPSIHRSYKFSLLTLGGNPVTQSQFVFFATRVEHLADPQRRFTLAPEEIALFNPNTRTMPIFRTRADAELTARIYRRVPVLVDERTGENPWGVRFATMFHMANDSGLFRTEPGDGLLPLYEAKMIWHFDHRFGSYEDVADRNSTHLPTPTPTEYADPCHVVTPWYYVPEEAVAERLGEWDRGWLPGFRNVTNTTNERTGIFAVFPLAAVGHSMPLILSQAKMPRLACLLANLNGLPLDYVIRQKLGGINLTYGYFRQFPIIPPSAYTAADIAFIVPHVLELVYTAWNIKAFADDLWRDAATDLEGFGNLRDLIKQQWEANRAATGGHPWAPPAWAEIAPDGCPLPPFKWDENRRAVLRAELDAYYARLYGLTRDELRYILDPKDVYGPDFPGETFRVLKEKEERAFGEYRTRRLVLEAWDRLEAELGPVVVRDYREEMAATTGRVAETGSVYQAVTPQNAIQPKFGARPARSLSRKRNSKGIQARRVCSTRPLPGYPPPRPRKPGHPWPNPSRLPTQSSSPCPHRARTHNVSPE